MGPTGDINLETTNKMYKISIIHPSRSRPSLAEATYHKWMDSAILVDDIQYILSVDTTDPDLQKYLDIKGRRENVVSDNKTAIEAINEGARFASADLLIVVSDDFDCPVGWDALLLTALGGKSDFVLKTDDGCQPWIITLPIMDRAYYNRFGYIYNPAYKHLFADTEMTHVADLLGRKITLPIKFPHRHYTQDGGQPKDAINEKNDATWAQGEAIYLAGVRNNFELADPLEITLPEAHTNWLKRKGAI